MPLIATISFLERPIATVEDTDLPYDLATEISWRDGDRFLSIVDRAGKSTRYDFGLVAAQEASCAALSLRISPIGAFQSDCLLGKDSIPSPEDFLAGAVSGLRLQPILLPGVSSEPPLAKGQGLFARGLHYPGMVTRSNVSLLCLCDECQGTFRLQSFHSRFSFADYYYCGAGLHTLIVDSAALSRASGGRLSLDSPRSEIEKILPPCDVCRGSFRYLNPLRCPYCRAAYIDFPKYPETRKAEYYGNFFFGDQPQHLNTKGHTSTKKLVIAEPGWGNLIVEDSETQELSLQCIGGGAAMYWHRVVLTRQEAAEFRAGRLDIDAMVWEMNHGTKRMAPRILPPFPPDELRRE